MQTYSSFLTLQKLGFTDYLVIVNESEVQAQTKRVLLIFQQRSVFYESIYFNLMWGDNINQFYLFFEIFKLSVRTGRWSIEMDQSFHQVYDSILVCSSIFLFWT